MIRKNKKWLKKIKNIIKSDKSYIQEKYFIEKIIKELKGTDYRDELGYIFSNFIFYEQFNQKGWFLKNFKKPAMTDWEEKLCHFMELPFNPNQFNHNKISLLFFVMQEYPSLLEKLFKNGVKPESLIGLDVDQDKKINNESDSVNSLILKKPCCFQLIDDYRLDILDVFIKNGLNLSNQYQYKKGFKKTLLIYSIQKRNKKAVRFLLKRGANPDECVKYEFGQDNGWNQSPLLSCIYNLPEMVFDLIKAGADYEKKFDGLVFEKKINAFEFSEIKNERVFNLIKILRDKKNIKENMPKKEDETLIRKKRKVL